MTQPAAHFEALGALLEAGDFLRPEDGLETYQRPARGPEGRAACILRPRTPDEVSRLLSYCIANDLALIVQSGHTGLVNDGTPDMSGAEIVLSLEKLRGAFDYNPLNRSLRVSAGYRLSEINARLEEQGVFLPIDLGADPMVGGLAATNTGGSRLLRYGGVREQVLALQVALASEDAPLLELGSACRKDNSAPDWKQVFIGSGAVFGVITECTFELSRRPVA
ncbi:MAG: FAD-binding oxidoreductase, partial [Hyphomonadaceae bacterium]|nr:FAD-binding oxidoreductase [Hyphomonadaceae bacterium]